jgi:hypothetical protein
VGVQGMVGQLRRGCAEGSIYPPIKGTPFDTAPIANILPINPAFHVRKESFTMARIDDYRAAYALAVEKLALQPFSDICDRTGLACPGADRFQIKFIDRSYGIDYPNFRFEDLEKRAREVPLQEQVLILHYMLGADPMRGAGEMIAYREIPGASFYFGPFVKRAIDPLKQVFGRNLDAFRRACETLDGQPIDAGDAGYRFQVFPQLAVDYILWEGDDEFDAEANILFTESTGECLSPEDAAWLAGMVVYRLMALSRG